ncbi:MAG: NAD(P)H-dependent glycerol-3-phosphate dehydrogenase [Candidatus Binataceae bacterium]
MKSVVLGAGAWGTALALILVRNGNPTTLCVRRYAHLAALAETLENQAYLPGIPLPLELELTDRWDAALEGAQLVVMAVPSRFARAAAAPLRQFIPPHSIIVSVSKGIEQDTLLTMSQMLAEVVPGARVSALAGPGFAIEIARRKPAALVAAARDEAVATELQRLFATRSLRIYRSSDILGIEIAGAVKNVIAIAAGIGDGLGLGLSARAALISRGLAEISRLAVAMGARRETVAGLAGLGDLILTCTSELSRNRAVGLRIGSGRPILFEQEGVPVAEGIANASAIKHLGERLGVEMPIVTAVYRVLYEDAPASAMVDELLSRGLKPEF